MTMTPLVIDPRVAERSWKLTDTRCQERLGHYEILLPERFRPVDRPYVLPSNDDSPVSVALFQTVDEPLAELEIVGLFLRREIAPADALEVLLADHTILEQRRVPSDGGDLLDVLTRKVADEPYLSRWWTVKDGGARGGRLYLLEARAAEGAYRGVADQLAAMLASFRLLHPTPWDYFERLTSLARKAPNDILLFYPESWQLEIASDGSDGPFIAHLWQVVGGRLLGRITIVSARGEEAPEAALQSYAGSLGAPVQWAPVETSAPFGGLEGAWTSRGRSALGGTVVDLTVHVGRRGGGTVLLGLAGVSAGVDALAAASLRRALEIVRETFRIA